MYLRRPLRYGVNGWATHYFRKTAQGLPSVYKGVFHRADALP